MKNRKRHKRPRLVETGCDAASRPDHFDGAPPFSFAPGNITFPPDADPVLRMPIIVERGGNEVMTPGGWVQVDKGFDTPAASEGDAQQDADPPGGRSADYPDIDIIEGA